ncbi:MAG: malonyl-[acyl-carrier protein] O-methyltransferase BioC [Candidatus Muproteobacteria bacterium RIFCSPHIGHO2_12_FULL_60_33]|uniref:Malonyl-[acyl-carrier protein] O-methyltransferase n=1 Tax=Candidatus Muproteobacteria bacterium RIFCSPLOWO2_01_FULL_60_18 TaxID=1817768 RepID=A0A1F6U4L7_9PROT|nr:MAG: malonyl-[acyl-carrier protein] O-methyltransferase BioC [Candidatus Muproteobacteria bacterium RIFCSPHIGHO2_01_60_12]OGI52298.1 MAG: malonyl-[acyl-carrier protein] O-methyltransferase BioC [Candidatus Muproteobacteria bacterium RIFCSPLOWO2_01_FULL_60_18]OGI54558.1 MAG: malonyl-[acyl-carrier protein] O-methyltransferase BioC [Candidatus Muproteobacteria bacterium RIFCSPHIGHO2_12_FULL_60_33]
MAELLALDKRRLRESFAHAVDTYDAAAVLQREIADRLLGRLDVVRLQPRAILDIGCGTGYDLHRLSKRYRSAQVLGLDIAETMTQRARRRVGLWRRLTGRSLFACGDAEHLPVATASVDMVVSNLALQWCDPRIVFAEARRVLRPGGLLMFTTFGPDTLRELRAAWRAADNAAHVHAFIDMHDLGDMLMHAGFADPVMDMETFTLTYPDVRGVMRDIKQLGAHNVAVSRARGLTGKTRFARFRAAYEALARGGKIPATYEAVYGHAWALETEPAPARDGVATIPVGRIGRSRS